MNYDDVEIAYEAIERVFETRDEMLSVLPANPVIAELGVFDGDYSERIFAICNPKELVLIDYWGDGNIVSGNENGDNIRHITGAKLYANVVAKLGDKPNVKIFKDWTSKILQFPDNYFDMVYIDANHEYDGVSKDLEYCMAKVKHGGWIMGHDYEMNNAKTKASFKFGVRKASLDFCKKYHQKVTIKGMDGCVSFGIKLNKLAFLK